MKTAYRDAAPYLTKDGSEIRELIHPTRHGNRNQSLAETANATVRMSGRTSKVSRASVTSRGPRLDPIVEATVPVGAGTALHRHCTSEELYHITAGRGRMTLGADQFDVTVGDSVCIPSGTPHCIENIGAEPLRILCCCAPAYAHDDTELLG
ncbi:MAG: cupin domain-containing protein [Gammaproteobacteria bacterium]|nr:cupin domain-containing protein [Gammaproteobacteria bacterium]